jgi:hypothetical protein
LYHLERAHLIFLGPHEAKNQMDLPVQKNSLALHMPHVFRWRSLTAKGGTPATELRTSAEVDFLPGTGITEIRLTVSGEVPNLDAEGFRLAAESAKVNCPVSQALKAVPIKLAIE